MVGGMYGEHWRSVITCKKPFISVTCQHQRETYLDTYLTQPREFWRTPLYGDEGVLGQVCAPQLPRDACLQVDGYSSCVCEAYEGLDHGTGAKISPRASGCVMRQISDAKISTGSSG